MKTNRIIANTSLITGIITFTIYILDNEYDKDI